MVYHDNYTHPIDDFSSHPMVNVLYSSPCYATKLATYLQQMAIKYRELGANNDHDDNWHKYFELSFQKFLMDLPKTPAERDAAVQKLTEWDCVLEAEHRGVDMQTGSGEDIVNAVAKKVAEYLLASANDTSGTDDAEGRPSKRIKVDGENATTFNFEVTVKVDNKDEDVAN
ncbi:hypothetical protein QBC45DRAFT_437403 [Copromyces sp. CBS 386.78]|nr:hypothetical protein QBC45DRAFT_437403 [Copromyces sp. CBS 386.78]